VRRFHKRCRFISTNLYAPFSPAAKKQASKQRDKGSDVPSYLEGEWKHQQLKLSAQLLEGSANRAKLEHHDLQEKEQGRPDTVQEEGTEQECVVS
jgi:hypothetical protein